MAAVTAVVDKRRVSILPYVLGTASLDLDPRGPARCGIEWRAEL